MDADLPFIDEHALAIPAPRDRVWSALGDQAERALIAPHGDPFRRFLGTSPPSGFGVAESVPEQRLALAGRHRFARYALVFELSDAADGGTRLAARTYAAFPGPLGRVYRALVIGTRAHVVATRRILVAVKRRTLTPAAGGRALASGHAACGRPD